MRRSGPRRLCAPPESSAQLFGRPSPFTPVSAPQVGGLRASPSGCEGLALPGDRAGHPPGWARRGPRPRIAVRRPARPRGWQAPWGRAAAGGRGRAPPGPGPHSFARSVSAALPRLRLKAKVSALGLERGRGRGGAGLAHTPPPPSSHAPRPPTASRLTLRPARTPAGPSLAPCANPALGGYLPASTAPNPR